MGQTLWIMIGSTYYNSGRRDHPYVLRHRGITPLLFCVVDLGAPRVASHRRMVSVSRRTHPCIIRALHSRSGKDNSPLTFAPGSPIVSYPSTRLVYAKPWCARWPPLRPKAPWSRCLAKGSAHWTRWDPVTTATCSSAALDIARLTSPSASMTHDADGDLPGHSPPLASRGRGQQNVRQLTVPHRFLMPTLRECDAPRPSGAQGLLLTGSMSGNRQLHCFPRSRAWPRCRSCSTWS